MTTIVVLSIVEISKTLMYEFRYDYIKPKYRKNSKIDTDSFIILIKTEDVYQDITDDVEKRFDTSNYEINRPLSTGKNKKVIGLMKDELGGKIMTEFAALRPKSAMIKKLREPKKCVIKRIIKFNDYKNCLLNNEIITMTMKP